MSAAEEDTELRDLLIHTLENNGVLNKIKAELRASVFLALEEQERAEDKPSLLNESLRQFLNTREGRLVAGLVTDFLQHFHLDFTLAVLQPEANLPSSPRDERPELARELGLPEAERGAPLLLQLIRHRGLPGNGLSQELPPGHMAEDKFHTYDRDKDGEISKEELRELLLDLFPYLHRDMLDRYIYSQFTAIAKDFSNGINLQDFLAMYQRLVLQGKNMAAQEVSELSHPPTKLQLDPKTRPDGLSDNSSSSSRKSPDLPITGNLLKPEAKADDLQLGLQEEDDLQDEHDFEGDSFFDDPIPKPEKTYGWKEEASKPNGSLSAYLRPAPKSEHSSHPESSVSDNSHHHSLKDLKSASEKMASLELGAGNDDDYVDDFNSTSQRSDKSEVSIGEDLDEELSGDDLTGSDNKLEDFTLDNSISHISDVADYLEDVS